MLSGGTVKMMMNGMDRTTGEHFPPEDVGPLPVPARHVRPGLMSRALAALRGRLARRPEALDEALQRLGTTSPHLLADIGVASPVRPDPAARPRVVFLSDEAQDAPARVAGALRPTATVIKLAAE